MIMLQDFMDPWTFTQKNAMKCYKKILLPDGKTTARRRRSRFLTHMAGDTPDGSHRYARLRRHRSQSGGTHGSAVDSASDPTTRGISEVPQPGDEADKRTPGCHRARWGADPGAGSPDRGSRRE